MDPSKKLYILISILVLAVLTLLLVWFFTKEGPFSAEKGGSAVFRCSDPINYQGEVYNTLEINEQCWLTENLRASAYRDGTVILNLTDSAEWREDDQGAYICYYNQEKNCQDYGALYNWYAVNNERGLCPEGWSVPTDEQWAEVGADNFKIVFGGFRNAGGPFSYLNEKSFLWTSTPSEDFAYARVTNKEDQEIRRIESSKSSGFSVRCVKDLE